MDTVFLGSGCRWVNYTTVDNRNSLGGCGLNASD